MMGEEEVSVAVENSDDNEKKNRFRFKLKRCGPRWVPVVTAGELCAQKQAKQGSKDVMELQNSFGQKEQPKDVSSVEKCYEVSNPNFSPKENDSCFQTISRFKLKRRGSQWFPEVTEREPCAKKQAKQGFKHNKELENSFGQKELPKEVSYVEKFHEVSNPNFPPKENSSCFQTTSSRKLERTVSDNQSEETGMSDNQGETNSTCLWSSSTEKNSSTEKRSCSSQFVLKNQRHDSLTVVRKVNFTRSNKGKECDNQISAVSAGQSVITGFGDGFNKLPQLNPSSEVELNMQNNVFADSCLTSVEEFLSTGILEGARVKYVSTSGNVKLWGIIKDGGYQCSCSICIVAKVLSAHEFELHAGGKSRDPRNHIYLENGNSINSIIQELGTTPLNMLEEVIKRVAGSSVNEEHLWTWKASLHQNNELAKEDDNCCSKFLGMHNFSTGPRSYFSGSVWEEKRNTVGCTKKRPRSYFSGSVREEKRNTVGYTKKRPRSYFSGSVQEEKRNTVGCTKKRPRSYFSGSVREEKRNTVGCTKKRPRSYFSGSVREEKRNTVGCTKKRNDNLHRLLFLPGGLQNGTKLAYCVGGEDKLRGYKQGNCIVCSQCNTEFSPSGFEAHAGSAAKRQAYRYICTTNGHTLHEIALQLSNGQSIQSIVPSSSDDKCAVCRVGGKLIFCDGCPCAYHAVCLGLEGIPTGDWHCSCCTENIGHNGRDPSPVILQPDQVVKPLVYQPGGCVVCRAQDFSVDTFDERKVTQCYQCGKHYHVSCLSNIGLCHLKKLPKDKWFCCSDCNSIHFTLQSLLLKVLPASGLDAVNKKHIGKGLTDGAVNSMHCRILSGKSSCAEDLPLLRKAAALFNECFKPIRSKTCRDLIAAMVRGKDISEQESRQFYCVVLIVDSVVSSASVLRIISREIAELPFVATRKKYRGKGYFRALFSCMEQLLVSMNVEKLVLPAAKHAESMWTNKLGFKKISVEELSEHTRDFQLTMFPETSMLEKVFCETNCRFDFVQTASQIAGSSRTPVMEEVQRVANYRCV